MNSMAYMVKNLEHWQYFTEFQKSQPSPATADHREALFSKRKSRVLEHLYRVSKKPFLCSYRRSSRRFCQSLWTPYWVLLYGMYHKKQNWWYESWYSRGVKP